MHNKPMTTAQIHTQPNGYLTIVANGERKGGFVSLEEAQAYAREHNFRLADDTAEMGETTFYRYGTTIVTVDSHETLTDRYASIEAAQQVMDMAREDY
jgi:hypothetical protein